MKRPDFDDCWFWFFSLLPIALWIIALAYLIAGLCAMPGCKP